MFLQAKTDRDTQTYLPMVNQLQPADLASVHQNSQHGGLANATQYHLTPRTQTWVVSVVICHFAIIRYDISAVARYRVDRQLP